MGPNLGVLVNSGYEKGETEPELYRQGISAVLENDLGIELLLEEEDLMSQRTDLAKLLPEKTSAGDITGVHMFSSDGKLPSDTGRIKNYVDKISFLEPDYLTIHPPRNENGGESKNTVQDQFVDDLCDVWESTATDSDILIENVPKSIMSTPYQAEKIVDSIQEKEADYLGVVLDLNHTTPVERIKKVVNPCLKNIHLQGSVFLPDKRFRELEEYIYEEENVPKIFTESSAEKAARQKISEMGIEFENKKWRPLGYLNPQNNSMGHLPPQSGQDTLDLEDYDGYLTLEVADRYLRPVTVRKFREKYV